MKGFLKFAGVIEFLLYIAGVIIYAFNVPLVGVNIFYFILFIVLGPTIAVLLFAVAQILENTEVNESKLNKLNKKVDLLVDKLVDDSSLKQINEEDNNDKLTFKALTSLTTEEKKQYKVEIHSLYNQFPFYKYAAQVKNRMIDVRNEALESIDTANTSVEAEKIVQAFKDALKDLE